MNFYIFIYNFFTMRKIFLYTFLILFTSNAFSQNISIHIDEGVALNNKNKSFVNSFLEMNHLKYIRREEQFYKYEKKTNDGTFEFTVSYNKDLKSQSISWSEWVGNINIILQELKNLDFVKGERLDFNNRIMIPFENLNRNIIISLFIVESENKIIINLGSKNPNKKTF